MKKISGVLFVLVLLTAESHASAYLCTNEDNVAMTLSIKNEHDANDEPGFYTTTATLKTGNEAVTMNGHYLSNTNIYSLPNLDSKSVSLKVSSVVTHGGRCGRCTPKMTIHTYAKLTIDQEEMNFTCLNYDL